ncbi:hypothetical protein [Caballeronia grimmiae]|uniref:hypothetical protein n=1 Tax=Caballeronia grimmiae TaxID=1071679 RepID=UPI0038BCA223
MEALRTHLLTQRPMIFEGPPRRLMRAESLPYVERRQPVKPEGKPPRELAKVTPFKLDSVRELLSRGFYAEAVAADACLSLAVVEYIGRHPEFTAAPDEPEPPKPAVKKRRPRTSAKRAAAAVMSTAAAPALQSIATATLAIASLATAAVTRSARNAPAPKPAVFKPVAPQNVRAPKLKTLVLALGNVEVSQWSRA